MSEENLQFEDFRPEYAPSVRLSNEAGTPGAELVGRVKTIREVSYKKDGEDKKATVAGFELISTNQPITHTMDGHVITIEPKPGMIVETFASGQLSWFLNQVGLGRVVKIVYKGKQKVEGYMSPLNQWAFQTAKTENAPVSETVPF